MQRGGFLQDLQLSSCKTLDWMLVGFLPQISSQNQLLVGIEGLSSFSFTEVTICALSLGFCSRSHLCIEKTIAEDKP